MHIPLCWLSFSSLLVSLLLSCSLSSSLPSLLLSPTRRVERPAAMSGKMRIRSDPKAPASDRQAMAIDSAPSASSDDALSVASSPPSASTPSVPSASPPTAGTSSSLAVLSRSKRPRSHQSDEVIDVDDDEKEGSSSSPSSVAASSLPPSGGSALGGQPSLPSVAQTAPNAAGPRGSSASGTLPPVNAASTMSFVPSFVRRETLLQQAGIDSRSHDTLVVDVQVLAAHHAGTPVISSLQYRSNEEARRDCAVSFIKKDTGLAMVCPAVPQYLTLRGGDLDAAVAKLSSEQRVWHDQLLEQARLSFDTVRDNSCSDGDRLDACEWVWRHLGSATGVGAPNDAAAPLWASPSSHATTWDLLLKYVGTSIMADKCPAAGSTSGVHSYTLRVQGANPLLTHVLACQFSSYALLRSETPEITKEWQALLSPAKATASSSISATDSSASSSGDEDGWQRARSDKRRLTTAQRHARLLPQRAVAFQQKHFSGKVAERFSADTRLPLLALSTTLRVRAWEERYTVCFVDNFASLGCDTRDLASDPIFVKLSTGVPGLTPPLAKWVVNPRNGGDTASIYVRDQDKDNAMPATLNAKVRALLPGSLGELRVDWRLWRTNTHGKVMYSLGSRKVCLNETVPAVQPMPVHSRSAEAGQAGRPRGARPPPAAGSWAAAVLHGVKRLPTANTLDHRPKKKATGPASSGPVAALQSGQAPSSGAVGATGSASPPTGAQHIQFAGGPHGPAALPSPAAADTATLEIQPAATPRRHAS